MANDFGWPTSPVAELRRLNGDRRDKEDVAEKYGERVLRYEQVITENVARIARNPERRKAFEAGHAPPRQVRSYWTAEWTGDPSPVKAITDKLLTDPDLAHEVWKILRNELYNAKTGKRRSGHENGPSGPASRARTPSADDDDETGR